MILRIELQSSLCTSTGVGRPGIADREVVFDAEGLPILPGRRLKGLLRDAYEELFLIPSAAGPLPDPAELFGEIGGAFSRQIRVGNGELAGGAEMGRWLRGARQRKLPVTRESVMAAFAGVRRQTSIARDTGAPARDTLRATRVIEKGTVFLAPVERVPPRLKMVLALSAAALQSMGTSRTRGLGKVCCRLLDDGVDLTEQAMAQLESGELAGQSSSSEVLTWSVLQESSPQEGVGALHALLYTVTLSEAALFPRPGSDANTVRSYDYVPGASVRGALAAAYLDQPGNRLDEQFNRLFLSGEVKYLIACPELFGNRALPTPLSVRRRKYRSDHVDLSRQEKPREGLSRADVRWCQLASLQSQAPNRWKREVRRTFSYHHARPRDNRIGRALSGEQAGAYGLDPALGGALFTYEGLAAGQTFHGAILGRPADLDAVRAVAPGGSILLRLGRSKSAQYGGEAELRFGKTVGLSSGGGEGDNWQLLGEPDELPKFNQLLVTLLSPMITVNMAGHPAPEFPLEQIVRGLQLPDIQEPVKAFARVEWTGGFIGHQGLAVQQTPALSAGSAFVLQLPRFFAPGELDAQIAAAEAASYGLRVEDGFGRVRICPRIELHRERVLIFQEPESDAELPPIAPDSPVERLLRRLLRRQLRETVVMLAMEHANDARSATAPAGESELKGLEKHLLSRVRILFERNEDLDQFRKALKQLRPRAQRQLEVIRVAGDTLLAYLMGTPPVATAVSRGADQWRDLPRAAEIARSFAGDPALTREYLRAFLATLAWRQRGNRTSSIPLAGGAR